MKICFASLEVRTDLIYRASIIIRYRTVKRSKLQSLKWIHLHRQCTTTTRRL